MPDEQKPAEGNQPPIPEQKPADLSQQIADAVKAERAKWETEAAEKAKKDADAAADKEAREQGKWKEIADKADADRVAAQAETARLRTEIELGKYLAANHPAFVGSAEYILPKIAAGLSDAKRAEAIKAEADKFAKAFAAATPKTAGAPAPRGTARIPSDRLPTPQRTSTAGVASSRF